MIGENFKQFSPLLQLLAKDKVEVKAASEENTSSSSSSQRGLSAEISASEQKGKGEGTSYVNSRLHVGGDYKVLAKDIVHEGAWVKEQSSLLAKEGGSIVDKNFMGYYDVF